MNTSMGDFAFGANGSYFSGAPDGGDDADHGPSILKMMPYDSTTSKTIHDMILQLDPEVFRDKRQMPIVSILRRHRYIIAAFPSNYQPKLGDTPPILGYCAFHEVEFDNNTKWFRIVSMGVVPDQRRMGLATRMLKRVGMFGSNNLYATFDGSAHLGMACLLQRKGAVIQPFGENVSMFKLLRSWLFENPPAKLSTGK